MFARNRSQEDLAHDPHLIFNVGRLVGAQLEEHGSRARISLQFFFEPDSRELKRMPVPSEAETVRTPTLGTAEKS
jgi:hypothetical protein